MPVFPPTLEESLRSFQRQIDEINAARLGPVSVGPGEGEMRFFDGAGDQFQILPSGAWTRFRGGMQSVTARFENDADAIEGHTATLGEHDGRITVNKNRNDAQDSILDSHGSRLGSAEGRLSGHDSTLSSHGSRISGTESVNGTQNTRLTDAESTNASQSQRISALEGETHVSPGEVNELRQEVDQLKTRVAALEAWRDSLPDA